MPHPLFILLDEKSEQPLYGHIYETIRRSIPSGDICRSIIRNGKVLSSTLSILKISNVSKRLALADFAPKFSNIRLKRSNV